MLPTVPAIIKIKNVNFYVQVIAEEGLTKFVDARTLHQEIADANDMTREDMDNAARRLLHDRSTPSYDHHIRGFKAEELKDYNKYSDNVRKQQSLGESFEDPEEQTVYVTAL